MNLFRKIFSKKWFIPTLLVLFGTALCIRLGIWQLDRLEQRRAFNTQVENMRATEMLDLNQSVPENINMMEWRAITVTGEYDFENQIALRNQYHENQYGYHLVTPLLFDGGAVFVNRGWIPAETSSTAQDWRAYDQTGVVTVQGLIRLGQGKPTFGGVADALPQDGNLLQVWNNLDLEKISTQVSYPVLEIFIQPNVDETNSTPPITYQPTITLTEGPHFEYALQWFTFATLLFFGYPFYVRKQTQ